MKMRLETILVFGFILTISAGCNDVQQKASQSESKTEKYSPAPEKVTLATLAKGCDVKNVSGKEVEYSKTEIKNYSAWTNKVLCKAAGEMVDRNYELGKNAMGTICEFADKYAKQIGGGSYDIAYQKISSWAQDNQTRFALNIIDKCRTKESRFKLIASSAPDQNIYSIGTANLSGEECTAFIAEMSTMGKGGAMGDSQIYQLYGTGQCKDFDPETYTSEIFHPESNPNGAMPGNYFASAYQYSGVMPKNYHYKGTSYPFK